MIAFVNPFVIFPSKARLDACNIPQNFLLIMVLPVEQACQFINQNYTLAYDLVYELPLSFFSQMSYNALKSHHK